MKYIIIPARGGSKGIPKKNLQKVAKQLQNNYKSLPQIYKQLDEKKLSNSWKKVCKRLPKSYKTLAKKLPKR